jgi:hypothetical protein
MTAVLQQLPVFERRAVTVKNKIQCKQDQIITWLQEYYKNPATIEKLLPILQGKSELSLRLVDYFVTNYAKKMNTSYMLGDKHFLVYFHYKRELNAYSKRLFDPYCRRERIMFEVRDHEPFVTTVGQLNFFRWFLEKGIYNYMMENRLEIEKDRNTTLKNHYSRSTNSSSTLSVNLTDSVESPNSTLSSEPVKQRKKRAEIAENAMRKVNVHECEAIVSFS